MKKMPFLFMLLVAASISNLSFAQVWTPNTNTTDAISRQGNVTIGTLSTQSSTPNLNVLAGASFLPPNGSFFGQAAAFTVTGLGTTMTLDVCNFSGGIYPLRATHSSFGSVFSVNATGKTTIGYTAATGTLLNVIGGNVVVGDVTTNANYKLFVEKGILTEKVKVAVKTTADWSDYVFSKDYKLMPLTEVETFVNKNKHLPGVPSAEDVVKEGIDMASMDATLLEKIEELTLYMIELKKENDLLKMKVESLDKQINR